MSEPLAYLITFRTYGTWLHGDERGSVDDEHNAYATPMLPAKPGLQAGMRTELKRSPVALDAQQRKIVESVIDKVCQYRDWTMHARQARSNHVHVVVSADTTPERVMGSLKSWCTRRLREHIAIDGSCPVWSRHGSTKYLWNQQALRDAVRYVVEGQGEDLP